MKKTLLVPTDFSANAKNAVDYAVAMAKKGNYKIILLNGFEISYPTSEIPVPIVTEEVSIAQKNAEKKLALLCQQIASNSKVECDYKCKEGRGIDVILDTEKKIKPTFIIMGTKGASGVKEFLFGSNTSKVIEKAKCPVIAVPKKGAFKGGTILFSTDYNPSDIDALKEVAQIAEKLNSTITLFHVADNELTIETEEGLMDAFLKLSGKKMKYKKITPQIEYGATPEKTLEKFIKKNKPGLVAMSTKHRTVFERIFSSSVTKKIANHTHTPLLAFHYKK